MIALLVIVVWLFLLMGLISSWLINAGPTALFARPNTNGQPVATLDSTQIVTTIVAISGLFTTALGFIWGYFFSQKAQSDAAGATTAAAGATAKVMDAAVSQEKNIALGRLARAVGPQGLDSILNLADAHRRLTDQAVARAQSRSELLDVEPTDHAVASLRLLRDEVADTR